MRNVYAKSWAMIIVCGVIGVYASGLVVDLMIDHVLILSSGRVPVMTYWHARHVAAVMMAVGTLSGFAQGWWLARWKAEKSAEKE